MAVRVDLNISLDGFATTTDQTPENPFGPDWARLVDAYVATRTFRARVLHETSGEGTTGVDDQYAQAYFAELGAEIMGAGMFGLHAAGGDPDWRGWWGDEPPFHVPVFVLTHSPRPVLKMAGGTTFHFLAATPREALDLAPCRPPRARTCGSAAAQRLSANFSRPDSSTGSTSPSSRSCSAVASVSGTTSADSRPATALRRKSPRARRRI